jgi:thioredoxin-like negative regulator of GroEL
MNPKENSPITVQTLLTLRQESDALRLITEKLQVKEMGPSDHIRTKHEAKAFVETGDVKAAEALIKQASERTAAHQAITQKVTQQQGQRP